jgi:hypothetical protein
MIIIGKEGCPDCKEIRKIFPYISYYELPDKAESIGDCFARLFKLLGIYPCVACVHRQYLLNEWWSKLFNNAFFKSDYQVDKYQKKVRIALAKHKIRKFPVILSDDLEQVIEKDL